VIEPAVGVDRIFLAVLCSGYAEEDVRDDKGNVEKRTVLRLSPRIAPVKVAVLPLLKEQAALVARAESSTRSSSADTRCSTTNPRDRPPVPPPGRDRDAWWRDDRLRDHREGRHVHAEGADSMQQRRINETELFALLEEKVY